MTTRGEHEAEQPARPWVPRPNETIQALQDRISAAARVDSVFGEPRELNGVQIIPVAHVMYGFGAGGGWGRGAKVAEEGGGEGAGGGVRISPVGYLTSDGAEVQFHDIGNWRRTLGILLLVFLIGRFLGRRGRGKRPR